MEATTSTPNLESKPTTEPTPSLSTETSLPVSVNGETVPLTISENPKSSSTMDVLLTTSYSNATDSNVDSKTVSSLSLDTQGTPISNITGTTTSSTSNIVTTSNDGNTPGSILIMIENLYVIFYW